MREGGELVPSMCPATRLGPSPADEEEAMLGPSPADEEEAMPLRRRGPKET